MKIKIKDAPEMSILGSSTIPQELIGRLEFAVYEMIKKNLPKEAWMISIDLEIQCETCREVPINKEQLELLFPSDRKDGVK